LNLDFSTFPNRSKRVVFIFKDLPPRENLIFGTKLRPSQGKIVFGLSFNERCFRTKFQRAQSPCEMQIIAFYG
jgi:hypothetical protein